MKTIISAILAILFTFAFNSWAAKADPADEKEPITVDVPVPTHIQFDPTRGINIEQERAGEWSVVGHCVLVDSSGKPTSAERKRVSMPLSDFLSLIGSSMTEDEALKSIYGGFATKGAK